MLLRRLSSALTMIIFPNRVQCPIVFTTTNPVTQFAEVAVNKAFKKPILSPDLLAYGKFNKNVPINIINANPSIIV